MSEDETAFPPSSHDVAGEDFLFHLYRGSELLQDNRVHDAKVELEQALALQPSDPKGQDLLAIVYFRLGLYPRAIQIFERLILNHPDATTPRVNLALTYLKTGQPAQARKELERVIQQDPNHSRAWGYLGLAFQRLGDFERAAHAFSAGGHEQMAKRLNDMAAAGSERSSSQRQAVVQAASEAFVELDKTEVGFRPDSETRKPSGTWSALEPGRESKGAPRRSQPPPDEIQSLRPLREEDPQSRPSLPSDIPSVLIGEASHTPVGGSDDSPSDSEAADHSAAGQLAPPNIPRSTRALLTGVHARPASSVPPSPQGPTHAVQLARSMLFIFPRDQNVTLHATGMVLVQSAETIAARFDAVRALSYPTGYETTIMRRRLRGNETDEPLGGSASPLFSISGHGELILGPAAGLRLQPVFVDHDPVYLRENAIVAFERDVRYENGRLPLGDGEAISMLQLRGDGAVVAMLPPTLQSIEVTTTKSVALRARSVIGWVGRVVPRTLPPSEAPAGVRGFVSFSGDGMVLVDVR